VAPETCAPAVRHFATTNCHTLTSDNRRPYAAVVDNLGKSFSGINIVADRTDLLQGTLDLLILKSLQLEPLHGWGISKRIRQLSQDALQVNQGSLYPALYRLEDQALIAASWGVSPEGRRAKFYRLTPRGEKHLVTTREGWLRFVGAVAHVLDAD
jgi:PadR family transcriptional regulator PadR